MILKIFFVILFIFFLIYIILYFDIELNDNIYFSKNEEQVIVIDKNIFTVTLARIAQEPFEISTLEFILNYSKYL